VSDESSDATPERPALRVVHGGEPTAEELAALTVVLAARAGAAGHGGTPRRAAPRSRWADRRRLRRPTLEPGPGGWLGSARR
jgi:hypothetical protein